MVCFDLDLGPWIGEKAGAVYDEIQDMSGMLCNDGQILSSFRVCEESEQVCRLDVVCRELKFSFSGFFFDSFW